MKKTLASILCISLSLIASAQKLSVEMESAISICEEMSKAVGSSNTSQLQVANKSLKKAKLENFGDLWLIKGNILEINGHFLFDEEFVDSLIVNRKVIGFSKNYAQKRNNRSSSSGGKVKMTTKALKAGKTAVWKTLNRQIAEYALISEPGGLFTMTITDENGRVLYAETTNNKQGAAIRKAKIQLPEKPTIIHIEISNRGRHNASFALLGH